MNIALFCVLLAGLMPLIWTGYAKFSGERRYNNRQPREFLEQLDGRAKRAHWAQLNSYEAFPFFAAAVLAAMVTGSYGNLVDLLAVSFIVIRLIYGVVYIADKAAIRSLVWALGHLAIIIIFLIAIF